MAAKNIRIEIVHKGGEDFEMHTNGQPIPNNKLVFNKSADKIRGRPMKKSDHYYVRFWIRKKHALRFASPADDAMYIKQGSASSTPPCYNDKCNEGSHEFTVTRVSDQKLKVKNLDKHECNFRFVMNFLDGSNNKVQFDPIYQNKNGGS